MYCFCSASRITFAFAISAGRTMGSAPFPLLIWLSMNTALSVAAFNTASAACPVHSAMDEKPYTPFLYTLADTPEVSDLAFATRLPSSSVTLL